MRLLAHPKKWRGIDEEKVGGGGGKWREGRDGRGKAWM